MSDISPLSEGKAAAKAATKPYGGKLCEGINGFDPAWTTEVGYVVQKDKVWFAYGKESSQGKMLTESLQDHANIVESMESLELYEDAEGKKQVKEGIWYVEGPAQRSDVINANKRIYGRKIWERLIANPKSPVQECIKARGMVGHLEHPKDGRTDGNLGAWVVTESKLMEDGVVWNKYELLDTPAGKILQEYTKKGVRYGSSSRGNGTVGEDGRVSDTDFMVETWDAVMRPSTPGAYPKPAKGITPKSEGVSDGSQGEKMTEDAKACEAQVLALVNESQEGAAEVGGSFVEALVSQLNTVNGLELSEALDSSKAHELRDCLTKKLSEAIKVHTTIPATTEGSALKAPGTQKTDKRDAAFSRVVESLQHRVEAVVNEAEDLRNKLTEAQEQLKARGEDLTSAQTALAESKAEAIRLQAKLDVATETIADLSARNVEDPVKAGIEEAISEVPALDQHRKVLEKATSPEELNQLLESLLPTVLAREPVAATREPTYAAKPSNRRSLPGGAAVISEGITGAPGSTGKTVVTGGAAVAARIVGRNAPVRA